MRNLTIRRTKSFVSCLAKMKIYIEDPTSNDIVINNLHCRKLGDIKNGEEKTFTIDDSSVKVYVIADKVSKNICNEYYNIPYGADDILLTGKNKFNPIIGNPFRFDGNTDIDALKNRSKGTKKGLVFLILACIIGFAVGYLIGNVFFNYNEIEPKTFSSNGMEITLTNKFVEATADGYTFCLDSQDVAVFALKESFDLADGFGDNSVEQYGELVLQSNGYNSNVSLQNNYGLTYFEYTYTNPDTQDTYIYFTCLYKANDAFWLIQFTTLNENFEYYSQSFIDWAKTVNFIN